MMVRKAQYDGWAIKKICLRSRGVREKNTHKPLTWMDTVRMIKGTPHAQESLHAMISDEEFMNVVRFRVLVPPIRICKAALSCHVLHMTRWQGRGSARMP